MIGVFDSGYGGLTILKEFFKELPDHDFIYLGDNARAPYGPRSFDSIYTYTLEAVEKLFSLGCPLVIVACNTASAKALRTIQQNDLPQLAPNNRVLGVLRPTIEELPKLSKNGHIGILGTPGTINSKSYPLEIEKLHKKLVVSQQPCPMWVPLVENNEHKSQGADYFIEKDIKSLLAQDSNIDTIVLGCTHFPMLIEKIKSYTPEDITIVSQDALVAQSLKGYLIRHPEIESQCSKNGSHQFFTTDSIENFQAHGCDFLGIPFEARKITINNS
ncbi:MAG: glutamate racemase [Fibrobacterales bacterium]